MIKKNILFLLFSIAFETAICQVKNINRVDSLSHKIKQINNSESFLQFLTNHAATFEDFDSLYSIIENKPCPKNFTYNLVNGDSSQVIKVSKAFLYLVARNFLRPPFNIKQSQVKSIEDLFSIKNSLDDPYNNFLNSYKTISPDIKNQTSFKIDTIEIKSSIIYCDTNQYLFVKNNIISWVKTYKNSDMETLKSDENIDLPIKNKLVVLYINQKGRYYFLKEEMGGSVIVENIYSYISAQVFNDILFLNINNKFFWIDVSP